MNELYVDFKEFFENKQMKDLLVEGNLNSNMDLANITGNKELKAVSKYF